MIEIDKKCHIGKTRDKIARFPKDRSLPVARLIMAFLECRFNTSNQFS